MQKLDYFELSPKKHTKVQSKTMTAQKMNLN
jgi:hypothetical protein